MVVFLKRAYESPDDTDGIRVLVDRIWPRGLSKARAKIDFWYKEAAPSTELRKWFGHDPERWEAFRRRYLIELDKNSELQKLKELLKKGDITLVYAAKDVMHNQAVVLKEILDKESES